ncbi:hypothetical protein MKW92_014466 [Papaver armeniacum]|nr:hypothetical protein MKW92_014466 [Papaver armeniacum]
MMKIPKFYERIESSFSVEAILDLKLNDEDIQVVSEGAFSDDNPNKSRAFSWINDHDTYRTYEINAESESEDFVGAYGCESASREFIQVYAQSGFQKQVEANADDANTNPQSGSQQQEADIVITGAGNGEEEEKEEDDGKQSVQEEEADADDSGTNRQSNFEQQEADNVTGARKEEQQVEEDDGKQPVQEEEADADDSGTNRQSDFEKQEADNVTGARKEEQEVEEDDGKQPVQEEEKDAHTITGTGEEEEAVRGHQVEEIPRVEEYLVTKIEPTKTQIKSSSPISTFNPFDVIGVSILGF